MLKVLKDVAKNGLIMFAVGALLALAAPALATVAGLSPAAIGHSADPLWMGSFFGAFGAIHSAITPLAAALFGESRPENAKTAETEPARAPEPSHVVEVPTPDITVVHSARIEQERSAASAQQQQLV